MLKYLNIRLNDTFHVDYDGSHSSESSHLSIIDCLVHIRTLRKLLLNGLIISARTTRALNRLLFVEDIRLCFMIFVIPADACGEVNLWSNKVQTLCFQARNLKKVLLFAKNTRLLNLSKIIMKDELYPIDINFNSIMSVHVQKIRVFVLISGHNPMMITLIEALQDLKTLRIENSSSSFITTLFKSRLIKHRIKELVIVKSFLESIALRRLTVFTRLKSLMLISVTFVPTLNHKVFSKFKNKFTLRIIDSNINFVDFYTIQKYEKIKSFDCYSKDKKSKTN
ncbi:hypothetical protein THOM_1483 [Trachipleistophora hominis]|uniref:Uncharacterized protein n=1 Tax=Trachipleistophora hominis TaxID=72359 RepID=L7JW52_TRAHO|nr:hypothetical protein THOM_1483 [Trachipleistophora hominis]